MLGKNNLGKEEIKKWEDKKRGAGEEERGKNVRRTDVLEVRVCHELNCFEIDFIVRQNMRIISEPHFSQKLREIGRVSNGRSCALSLPIGLPKTSPLKKRDK